MHFPNLVTHSSIKFCAAIFVIATLFVASKGGGAHSREPNVLTVALVVVAAIVLAVVTAVTTL